MRGKKRKGQPLFSFSSKKKDHWKCAGNKKLKPRGEKGGGEGKRVTSEQVRIKPGGELSLW